MSFDKLKGKMAEKRISQDKMAQYIGITVQAFNAKINGRSQFTLEEVVKMTEFLGITNPKEIFFESNIPNMQR